MLKEDRYVRQTLLTEIGEEGQKRLGKSRVAIVGCGGLGSVVGPYLAGAGVGELTLIDGDNPEITNVHRQVFFSGNEKQSKAASLAKHIQYMNPEVKVTIISEMLSKKNINQALSSVDLVLECTDDIMTKYLVNDFCAINKQPMVYGAIYKFDGFVSLFENTDVNSIHLRDAFPIPDLNVPSCSEVGVLNTIAGLIGMLQANEALKHILQIGESLAGKMLSYNALDNQQWSIKLKKTFDSDITSIYHEENYGAQSCAIIPEISVDEFRENIADYHVISVLEDDEHEAITADVERIPMSDFSLENWQKIAKTVVVYCMTGKRSATIADKIKFAFPEQDIYSLTGGLQGFKDQKVLI